ncbi:aspartyl-phosphate phosphatase Spo0E family protein [Halobacillus sp. BBL2006]|nr:aspartyl-phosphate phosphatase Spo0E family protein [Halobacillus sp. BBL2006]
MGKTVILEEKIEYTRWKMYEAYLNNTDYQEVLRLSQKLDHLLNQLKSA